MRLLAQFCYQLAGKSLAEIRSMTSAMGKNIDQMEIRPGQEPVNIWEPWRHLNI